MSSTVGYHIGEANHRVANTQNKKQMRSRNFPSIPHDSGSYRKQDIVNILHDSCYRKQDMHK